MLSPRAPGDPRSRQMDGCATSTNIGSGLSRYTYKKASGQGVRMHPPMVLLAIVRERDKSVDLLLGISSLPSSLCEG